MATFGTYNNTASPKMKWYAEYSYSRTSNSRVSVTLTVYGEILNHAASSYMGTGNNIVVTGTVGTESKTYEIKASSSSWKGNASNPRSCTFSFSTPSDAAGQSIGVSYSVAGSGYTAPATVPKQSTSFSSPALLYTASTIAASVSSNAVTVTITRQNDSMTHTLTYNRGTNSIQHTGCTTSDSCTIPASWITDNASGAITVTCDTYVGSTFIGSVSKSFTVTVPASVVPTITATAYTIVDSKFDQALQGISKVKWSAAAAGADGSWITESYISGGGYTTTLTGTTGILYTSGNNVFTIHAKDSRGRTCSGTVTIAVTAYARPSVSVQSTQRCLSDGTVSDEGTYLRCAGTASFDAVGGKNSMTATLKYRTAGSEAWSNPVSWTPGTVTIIGGGYINADTTCEVWYQVQDQITSAYYIDTVLHKRRIIDAYEDDTGVQSIGIGGAAKEDGKTTVYNPLTCLSPAQFSGGQWVHTAAGNEGTRSFIKFVEIKILKTYVNTGISFDIIHRRDPYPSRVNIQFENVGNTDPNVDAFTVYGSNNGVWIKKETTSTWGIYVYMNDEHDRIDVVGFTFPGYMQYGVSVNFVDVAADNVDGATQATIGTMKVNASNATSADSAKFADFLTGFAKRPSDQTWGVQTGTYVSGMNDITGGSVAWRRDCPSGGQLSMVIDGLVYVAEGTQRVIHTGDIYGNFERRSDGSAGGYIKIGDYQICFGWLYFNIAVSTATGNSYYGVWEGTHNYARAFGDTPAVTLTVNSDLIKSTSLITSDATGFGKVQLFDSRSRTAQGWYVYYVAVGKA